MGLRAALFLIAAFVAPACNAAISGEDQPHPPSSALSGIEKEFQSLLKASLAVQSIVCKDLAATARIRAAAERDAALGQIVLAKVGTDRAQRLLYEIIGDTRNIYTLGCPPPDEQERRVRTYEQAVDRLAAALGSPRLPLTRAPPEREPQANLGSRPSQIRPSKAPPTSTGYRWRYVERGGDPVQYPGPAAWYGGMGFMCLPQKKALSYIEGATTLADGKLDFSISVGSVTWTGPAARDGIGIQGDIPLSHPVIEALTMPQREPLGIRFGPYPYEIPHDPIVQRVAKECRTKAGAKASPR